MAVHVYNKLQMMTEDDNEREILQRVLKESLNMSQSVSQSTDRISLAQFNTFSQQFIDQQSESPIKVPQKMVQSQPNFNPKGFDLSDKPGDLKH